MRKTYKNKNILLLALFLSFFGFGQEHLIQDTVSLPQKAKFNYKALVIPTVLIGYGVIGLNSDQLLFFNSEIKNEVQEDIDLRFTIDDISQYVPMAATYGLDFAGIKSEHRFKDKLIISVTSTVLMAVTVGSLKRITHVERPDGSNFRSFPSGHTANAFMGAEFLYQEYKNNSIWYGISGYTIATGTGMFRIVNNRHWLTDVAAGAGIGILSTKAAYWLYPTINKWFKKNNRTKSETVCVPIYTNQMLGLGFVKTF